MGVNFAKGFGPQPSALIRNRVAAAPCIGGCGGNGDVGGLIVNGGFESGVVPWVFSGAAYRSTPVGHDSASTSRIASDNNEIGAIYQEILVPKGEAKNLTFWLHVFTFEGTTDIQFDQLFVEARSASGELLATLATFSNLDYTGGLYAQKGPYDLSAFAGQRVRIQFRAANDYSLPTQFSIDDVWVK